MDPYVVSVYAVTARSDIANCEETRINDSRETHVPLPSDTLPNERSWLWSTYNIVISAFNLVFQFAEGD